MPLLLTAGMQGLHGVGKLAKARLYRGNVGRAGVVGAEIRSQELPHPSGHEVRVSRADDQPARCLGVSRADLQGHLAPIAVTANHWAVQFKGGDQRGDIVGDLPVRHFAARIGRAAVPATVGRDDAEIIYEGGQQRLPNRARDQPRVDQYDRRTRSAVLAIERCTVDLDPPARSRRFRAHARSLPAGERSGTRSTVEAGRLQPADARRPVRAPMAPRVRSVTAVDEVDLEAACRLRARDGKTSYTVGAELCTTAATARCSTRSRNRPQRGRSPRPPRPPRPAGARTYFVSGQQIPVDEATATVRGGLLGTWTTTSVTAINQPIPERPLLYQLIGGECFDGCG